MMKVRRTMTEILLTVTSRHIDAICREELQRFVKKHKGIMRFRLFSVVKINKLLRLSANINRLFPDEKVKKLLIYPLPCVCYYFVKIVSRVIVGHFVKFCENFSFRSTFCSTHWWCQLKCEAR